MSHWIDFYVATALMAHETMMEREQVMWYSLLLCAAIRYGDIHARPHSGVNL